VDDGSVIDTKGWGGWEWTHGIALTALYRVSRKPTALGKFPARPVLTVFDFHNAGAQHAALAPSSPSNRYSLETALDWFRAQYRATNGKGVPKNINTMAPFYSLACAVEQDLVPAEEKAQWVSWLVEWAEWIMHDLPSEWKRKTIPTSG
jgi:unsaturated rhamnogalacturonyl hydrolase